MEERLIDFSTAKLAKEKGISDYFNSTEYVKAFYSEDGINFEECEFMQKDCVIEDRYFRPTQSLLRDFLRKVHGIYIEAFNDENKFEKVLFEGLNKCIIEK